jgi:hypothetical protein
MLQAEYTCFTLFDKTGRNKKGCTSAVLLKRRIYNMAVDIRNQLLQTSLH